jgi:hypothetical protein
MKAQDVIAQAEYRKTHVYGNFRSQCIKANDYYESKDKIPVPEGLAIPIHTNLARKLVDTGDQNYLKDNPLTEVRPAGRHECNGYHCKVKQTPWITKEPPSVCHDAQPYFHNKDAQDDSVNLMHQHPMTLHDRRECFKPQYHRVDQNQDYKDAFDTWPCDPLPKLHTPGRMEYAVCCHEFACSLSDIPGLVGCPPGWSAHYIPRPDGWARLPS